MRELHFRAIIEPRSVQHGARARRDGKGIRYYNDPDKVEYLSQLRLEMEGLEPPTPLLGPLQMKIHFLFSRPKHLLKKESPECPIEKWGYSSRNDVDNLIKGLLDAMEGQFFVNDNQVWRLRDVAKSHCEKTTAVARIEGTIYFEEQYNGILIEQLEERNERRKTKQGTGSRSTTNRKPRPKPPGKRKPRPKTRHLGVRSVRSADKANRKKVLPARRKPNR